MQATVRGALRNLRGNYNWEVVGRPHVQAVNLVRSGRKQPQQVSSECRGNGSPPFSGRPHTGRIVALNVWRTLADRVVAPNVRLALLPSANATLGSVYSPNTFEP